MALGKGIGIMGRGAASTPEALAQRQKLAMQLYANSITPQQPEKSWTQGAARLAQSLVSGYEQAQVDKERQGYDQAQSQGMAALLSGDGNITPEVAASLPANQQMIALQLMQNQKDHALAREEKAADRKAAMSDKLEYAKESRSIDPVKKIQDEIYKKQQELQDPTLPPHLKAEIEAEIKQISGSMSAISPSKTTVNVDNSQKADDAGLKKRKELLEEDAVKKESEAAQIGLNAEDNAQRMNQINSMIESGELNNQNTANLGQAVQKGLARINAPNDSAAIGQFIQAAKQQLIDARKQLAGQGQVSNYEGKLLADTVLQDTDTMENVKAKLFVYKQVFERQKTLARIQNDWVKRYGSTTKPAENGMNFRDVVTNLYSKKPLISYADSMKKKAEAASGQLSQPNINGAQQ